MFEIWSLTDDFVYFNSGRWEILYGVKNELETVILKIIYLVWCHHENNLYIYTKMYQLSIQIMESNHRFHNDQWCAYPTE